MLLIAQYLLAGVIISFIMEHLIRFTESTINGWERGVLIILWPVMSVIFIYHFIKGLLED
tara:strand:- start:478 stop:657 length:180 start_codon:yes stop_codon:yes gene_type:complete